MRNARLYSIIILIGLFGSLGLQADVMLLWPDGAPGATGNGERDIPKLTLSFPAEGEGNGAAVVICPGGSYAWLSMDVEGSEIAQWFNSIGVTAAVLKYRLPGLGYPHPAPMRDVQHALQTLRANSEEWGLDPERIGVLGSSAGGHLAATAATHFLAADPQAADPVSRVSSRPNFALLLYPVVSMHEGVSHMPSRNRLIGEDADAALIDLMSADLQVSAETPPSFLIHADDDKVVPPENSVQFYLALRAAGVPAALHIFNKGGHGFRLRTDGVVTDHARSWPALAEAWLRQLGMLDR
jgi:acetyl esterase/lipase